MHVCMCVYLGGGGGGDNTHVNDAAVLIMQKKKKKKNVRKLFTSTTKGQEGNTHTATVPLAHVSFVLYVNASALTLAPLHQDPLLCCTSCMQTRPNPLLIGLRERGLLYSTVFLSPLD